MSNRKKAGQLLKDLPNDIPMKEIINTLSLILEPNDRLDTFDGENAITSDQLLYQIIELDSEE